MFLILSSSSTSRHITRMRSLFLLALLTATQRPASRPSSLRISLSTRDRRTLGLPFSGDSSGVRDVSMVQKGVSVNADGASDPMLGDFRLDGELIGGVFATSAYDSRGLCC